MPGNGQADFHLRFQSGADLGDVELDVEAGHGREHLSQLYEYTARVAVRGEGGLADDVIDEMLLAPACLTVGAHAMEVHGVLTRLEMLSVHADGEVAYEITLAPRISRLALTRRSRVVAQDQSHLDAVKLVLDEHGIPYEDACGETYAVHEHIVQYQETDLAFVLRLLEHNGIHFSFRQEDENEVLVLGDANRAFESAPEQERLRYDPTKGRPGDGDARVTSLRRVRQPRTAEVVLREYDWRSPTQPLRAEAQADERSGAGRWDLYGEHWREASDGQRLARVRAEEQLVVRDVYFGETAFRVLRPGMWFELEEHPLPELNRRYLIISTTEALAGADADYRKQFEAIPFDVPYRPARATSWPRIEGLVNALVDGEARSTATPVDDQGRYRLVLPLDEAAAAGGRASRWVRRAQPSAGSGYGMHFPLHIGTEVAVGHVHGDPDRPVILGAVPNAATQSPVASTNATQEVIRSASGIVIELENEAS